MSLAIEETKTKAVLLEAMSILDDILKSTSIWAILMVTRLALHAADVQQDIASVCNIVGSCRYYTNGWHELRVGAQVTPDLFLQTGSMSYVEIQLSNPAELQRAKLILSPNTVLSFAGSDLMQANAGACNQIEVALRAGGISVELCGGVNHNVRLNDGAKHIECYSSARLSTNTSIVFHYESTSRILTVEQGALQVHVEGQPIRSVACSERLDCDRNEVLKNSVINAPRN